MIRRISSRARNRASGLCCAQNFRSLTASVNEVTESALPRLGQVGRGLEDDKLEGIVVMRKGENPSEVIARLHDKFDELNTKILPPDVKMPRNAPVEPLYRLTF